MTDDQKQHDEIPASEPPPTVPASSAPASPLSAAPTTPARTPAASGRPDGLGGRIWARLRPLLDQAILNMRVWAPYLATPVMREHEIRYGSKQFRKGLRWEVVLDEQCWQCGRTDGLGERRYDLERRCFENPIGVVATSGGFAALFLLIAYYFEWPLSLILSLISVAAGVVVLAFKSWKEQIRLAMWSCSEHADELTVPRMVVYDDRLHLFAPTTALAEAGRTEVLNRRRVREPIMTDEAVQTRLNAASGTLPQGDSGSGPPSGTTGAPRTSGDTPEGSNDYIPRGPVRAPLPSIQFDDEPADETKPETE